MCDVWSTAGTRQHEMHHKVEEGCAMSSDDISSIYCVAFLRFAEEKYFEVLPSEYLPVVLEWRLRMSARG